MTGEECSIIGDTTAKVVWIGTSAEEPADPDNDYLPGDVDRNGKVNIRDVVLVQQYTLGWDVDIFLPAANVDGNNKVNIRDVVLIQQYSIGWNVTLLREP